MQIIRPYGQSRSANHEEERVRKLLDKEKSLHDIADFSEQHAELIIAHWVSVIDKIARKPRQSKSGKQNRNEKNAGATLVQYNLREALRRAAWEVISTTLPSCDHERQEYLEALWRFKIHPYGAKPPAPPTPPRPGEKSTAPGDIKGRWYKRFVGEIEPDHVTDSVAKNAVEQIRQHLYHNELRLGEDTKAHREGKIPAQAKSIRDNVLKRHRSKPDWAKSDEQAYAAYDVAAAIHAAATQAAATQAATKVVTNKKHADKPQKIKRNHAGKCLFEHWAKIFRLPDGTVMNVAQALQEKPQLFALHQAVKGGYARLLKHTKKTNASLLKTLPKNMDELYRLIGHQVQNRDLASLVQLGKVIYYREAKNETGVIEKETCDIEHSRFWGSDGQAEIKRNEAFVRVWRHGIGQANLTLANWAFMKKPLDRDILGGDNALDPALKQDNFDATLFDEKAALIFGNDADLFTGDRKATLEAAFKGMSALRHAAFHFKRRKIFLTELEEKLPEAAKNTPGIEKLWLETTAKRAERLIATLQGAHALHYFTQSQVQALIHAISADQSSHLPLPRFSRVLERHGNIRAQLQPPLPPTANRNDLEQNPAQKCQYITLKLLYERAFRPWLETISTDQLQRWITAALKRTTNQAKRMNAKGDADKLLLIAARAEQLPRLNPDEDIRQFFFNLAAATASEMRVQRGYASDAEAAQEQAEYIDELLCDVLALAFQDYLVEAKFGWTLDLNHKAPLPEAPHSAIDKLTLPASNVTPRPWQQVLYFLLHLMPVGEVSQLLHQLAKWEITAGRVTALLPKEKQLIEALQYTMKC